MDEQWFKQTIARILYYRRHENPEILRTIQRLLAVEVITSADIRALRSVLEYLILH
jgi:tRNA C32,U32 (ribose-2'-O)-methylase TrmJ